MVELIAFLSTPIGQAVTSLVCYLVAKRFPLAQRIIWAVLDVFRVPRPDRQAPSAPSPPTPGTPSDQPPGSAAVDARPVRDLIRDLVGVLTARGRFGEAAAMLKLAPELDKDGDGIPDAMQRGGR